MARTQQQHGSDTASHASRLAVDRVDQLAVALAWPVGRLLVPTIPPTDRAGRPLQDV